MIRALVFGRAQGVWEELAEARRLGDYDHIIACGSVGVDCPSYFDCWVSFHADMFPDWIEQRRRKGFLPAKQFFSASYHGWSPRSRAAQTRYPATPVRCEGGSSGLIAVIAALDHLKADRVVLAGVPMEANRGQYDSNLPWKEAVKHQGAWEAHRARLVPRVRSMSGWTQKLLGGAPTKGWLAAMTCADVHHNYIGKCPYCHTVLPEISSAGSAR